MATLLRPWQFSLRQQVVVWEFTSRGARSARAYARLCTSSGINLIVPLSFHIGNLLCFASRFYTFQIAVGAPGKRRLV